MRPFFSERELIERNYCGRILLSMNSFTALPVCIVLSMKSQGIANIPLNKLTVIRIITSLTLFKSLIVKASAHSSFWVPECIDFSLETRKELVMTPNPINYSQISRFTPNATKWPVQDAPAHAVQQQIQKINKKCEPEHESSIQALVLFSRQWIVYYSAGK